MRIKARDTVGLVLVACTFTAVYLHERGEHKETHLSVLVDAGGATTSAETVPTFAFVNFNVVPMDGQDILKNHVVVVRNGFVTTVGPVGVVEAPAGATLVEGDGSRFLVPGLVDAHVHIVDASEDLLPLFIANGVTTVFNLKGDDRHLDLRDRARQPGFEGPTIFTAGPFVPEGVELSPADARREVEAQADAGYDFIKIHGALSSAAYAALTQAASDRRIAVVGHAPQGLPFSEVLANGQVAIVHADQLIHPGLQTLDSTQASSVAADMAAAGMWLTPTVSGFENVLAQWASPEGLARRMAETETRYLPSSLRRAWSTSDIYVGRPRRERARIEEMHRFLAPLVRTMNRAGVRILAGTDALQPGMVPGFSLHDELDALEALGMSPVDVLAAATVNAGRFVRGNIDPTALFGTIETGARADILVVEHDPRSDLRTLRRPLGVMVRGEWYDRARLDLILSRALGAPIADDMTPQ